MRPAAPLAASLALIAGLAAPAAAFSPERAAILVDAVRDNGCEMAGQQAPAALEPLGLDAIEVQSFVDILYGADLVRVSDDLEHLILSDQLCAAQGEDSMALIVSAFASQEALLQPWEPDFTPARGAEFVAVLRGNDCGMSDAQAGDILPGHGFTPEVSRDIVTVMLEGGLANLSEDASQVNLSAPLCAADPAEDTATLEAALAAWHAAQDDMDGQEVTQ